MASYDQRDDTPRSPFEIAIANEQSALPIDEGAILRVVQDLLRIERVTAATVSIAIVDDATIHVLNREHLAHDYPTDVLSFALHEDAGHAESGHENSGCAASGHGDRGPGAPHRGSGDSVDEPRPTPRGAGLRIDGEVVVSAETAVARAAEFRWSPHDELLLYIVHGLLHVVGYDDTTEDERGLMRSREQAVLRERGLAPRYHGDSGSDDPASPPPGSTCPE